MSTGIVKKFVDDKGFGFISQDKTADGRDLPDVFFHFTNVQDFENGMIGPGVRVEFEWEEGERGLQARKYDDKDKKSVFVIHDDQSSDMA